VFETIAFVSTVVFILIFVGLVYVDRTSRQDDQGNQ
jgi:hypothetical protein